MFDGIKNRLESIPKPRLISILAVATIMKIIVVALCYQNIMTYSDGEWAVVEGYTWDDYIRAIANNSYTVPPQKSLAGVVRLESSAYRPPIFPYYVYSLHLIREYGPLPGVVVFSILTSLISLLAFKLVRAKRSGVWPLVAAAIVFLMPMNFLKSGVLDEAVIMLPLILGAVLILDDDKINAGKLMVAGLLLGLAVLTRYTALLSFLGIGAALLLQKKFVTATKLGIVLIVVVSPWIVRNIVVLGAPVLSTGGARFGVVTSSDDFIQNFPEKSIDEIEIAFFSENHDEYRYLRDLNEIEREEALTAEFMAILADDPGRVIRSVVVKMKVFVPLSYYPLRGSAMKDVVYLTFYVLCLAMLAYRLVRYKEPWSIVLWFAAFGYALQGPLFVMTSRHMYPVIVFVIIAFMRDFSLRYKPQRSA